MNKKRPKLDEKIKKKIRNLINKKLPKLEKTIRRKIDNLLFYT